MVLSSFKRNPTTPKTPMFTGSMCCLQRFHLGWDGHGDSKWVQGPIAACVSQPYRGSGAMVHCPIAPSAQPGTLAKTFNVTSTVLGGG